MVKLRKFQEAYNAYRGDLARALKLNLEAHSEVLSLLKPFFPSGWSTLPASVRENDASYLANEAANALDQLGNSKSSLDAYGAALESYLRTESWSSARAAIGNIANSLARWNKIAQQAVLLEMQADFAFALGVRESIFSSLLDQFTHFTTVGEWSKAQAAWTQLDPMGRAWPRSVYRPGYAELWQAFFEFCRGKLHEEQLAEAERLLKLGKERSSIREGHSLRGHWHLERSEWSLAAASLHEAIAMARAVGQTDAESETQLALARFHLNQLPDPHHEAERLAGLGSSDAIAELYLAIDDLDRAKHHALAAYKRYWADGEPYVYRYRLNKSRALLEKLNVPIPNLPPYDPSNPPTLPLGTRRPRRHRQIPRRKSRERNQGPRQTRRRAIARHLL